MRHILVTSLLLLALGAGALHAQVHVQVNGDQSYLLRPSSGLYFSHDTMRVVTAEGETSYALADIRVITLSPEYTGIALAESEQMRLMPNPAREYIRIEGVGSQPQTARLYDRTGREVLRQNVADGTLVDLRKLPEGLYVLRCGNRVSKIVKQQ